MEGLHNNSPEQKKPNLESIDFANKIADAFRRILDKGAVDESLNSIEDLKLNDIQTAVLKNIVFDFDGKLIGPEFRARFARAVLDLATDTELHLHELSKGSITDLIYRKFQKTVE